MGTTAGQRLTTLLCAAALLRPSVVVAQTPATPAGNPPARITAAAAEALVREVSASVEKIRGLKFKTPVKMEIIDGATARESFKSKIEPGTQEEVRHTQSAYVHLGLIPRNADLLTDFLDLAEKDLLGYYQPGSKTFYLLSNLSAEEVRSVMAHELTHALEDQHYDLSAVSKKASGDSDHETAISAVIEGSAMVVMLAYLSREGNKKKAAEELEKRESQRAKRLKAAPSFTQRSLMLPYILGITFLLRGKPWEWFYDGVRLTDIDQAYATPPRSTRQILHPEQYWVGRARVLPALTLPDFSSILGRGWSKATDGSIGELGLSVLTGAKLDIDSPEVLLPSRWTNEAAAGVIGDLFQHYVNGELRVTLLVTRWETERDADQFDRALVNRGKFFFRYGVNIAVLAGDVGDKADALAMAALRGASYWPAE